MSLALYPSYRTLWGRAGRSAGEICKDKRQARNLTNMKMPIEISLCTQEDYNRILEELPEFWEGRDARHLHHPFLIHEFGNSAFVIRDELQIVAYLFGFVSQTEPVG